MLSLFRTNQLLVSVLLLFFIAILRAYPFFFPVEWTAPDHGVFAAWLYNTIGENNWVSLVVAGVLIFFQGILINVMASFHRLDKEVTMIPGLIYVTFCSLLPEFLLFSPLLIANTFLLLAILELLQTYKKTACNDHIFNVGFWIGIASFCYVPYLGFAIGGLMGLGILRPFKLGERVVFLSGIIVPYFLLGLVYFWFDDLNSFLAMQFGEVGKVKIFPITLDLTAIFKSVLFVFLVGVSILGYRIYVAKKGIDVQKKIDIFYWMMLSSLLIFAFHQQLFLEQILATAIPLGLFISLSLTNIANRWAETWFFFMVLVALLIQYYPLLV